MTRFRELWFAVCCLSALAIVSCAEKRRGKYLVPEPGPPVMYNETVFQEDVDYTNSPPTATVIPVQVVEQNLNSYSTPSSQEDFYHSKSKAKVKTTTTTTTEALVITDATTMEPTTTRKPPVSNKNGVQDIISLLAEKIKANCDYDEFSPIAKICPVWEKTVTAQSTDPETGLFNQKNYDRMMGWTFKDIERFIIDNQTVEKLKSTCILGQWCLNGDTKTSTNQTLTSNFMSHHSKQLCLITSCFDYLDSYFEKCIKSSISRDILKIIPQICLSSGNTTSNNCFERSLRLVYVGYVAENAAVNMTNSCNWNLNQAKVCSDECKSIAYDLNKFESCCDDLTLVKSYQAFNWYFDNRKVREYCDLPLRTFCWQDGKYFIDIDTQMLIICAVAIVLITILILLIVYVICLRRISSINTSSNDSFGYSQLSQTVFDDELAMESTSYRDENPRQSSGFLNTSRQKEYEISNFNLSRFTNQQ